MRKFYDTVVLQQISIIKKNKNKKKKIKEILLTASTTVADIACEPLALMFKCADPSLGTEGKARIHQGFVEAVHSSVMCFDMLHHVTYSRE